MGTRHFSDVVVVGYEGLQVGNLPTAVVDSGFRPGWDDWQFPNYGSVIEPGGHCAGQSIAAMWYYTEQHRKAGLPPLHDRFDNNGGVATTELWQDDADPYRLVSTVQHDIDWGNGLVNLRRPAATAELDSLQYTAFGLAVHLTGEPQYVAIYQLDEGGEILGGHAMVVYRVGADGLNISDPNYPGEYRTIPWDPEAGTLGPYWSKPNRRGDRTEYAAIGYAAKSAMVDWNGLGARWQQFINGTAGDDLFPTVGVEGIAPDGRIVDLGTGSGPHSWAVAEDERARIGFNGLSGNVRAELWDGDRYLGGLDILDVANNSLDHLFKEPGVHDYGIALWSYDAAGQYHYVDFFRIEVTVGSPFEVAVAPPEQTAVTGQAAAV